MPRDLVRIGGFSGRPDSDGDARLPSPEKYRTPVEEALPRWGGGHRGAEERPEGAPRQGRFPRQGLEDSPAHHAPIDPDRELHLGDRPSPPLDRVLTGRDLSAPGAEEVLDFGPVSRRCPSNGPGGSEAAYPVGRITKRESNRSMSGRSGGGVEEEPPQPGTHTRGQCRIRRGVPRNLDTDHVTAGRYGKICRQEARSIPPAALSFLDAPRDSAAVAGELSLERAVIGRGVLHRGCASGKDHRRGPGPASCNRGPQNPHYPCYAQYPRSVRAGSRRRAQSAHPTPPSSRSRPRGAAFPMQRPSSC